jgi:hypothetical protein
MSCLACRWKHSRQSGLSGTRWATHLGGVMSWVPPLVEVDPPNVFPIERYGWRWAGDLVAGRVLCSPPDEDNPDLNQYLASPQMKPASQRTHMRRNVP